MVDSPSQNEFFGTKSRGRKTRCLPASADTAWNLDQPLLEANTRRVIFLSTTRHAHAAGHVHHHSHHHVVRLSKLHNTTRLLSLKITVSGGNERSITQFSALVNPRIHKKQCGIRIRKIECIDSKIRWFAARHPGRGCTGTPRRRRRGSSRRSSRAPFWRARCFRRCRARYPPPTSAGWPRRRH